MVKDSVNNNDDSDEFEDVSVEEALVPVPEQNVVASTYYMNACFEVPTVPGMSHEDNLRTLSPDRLSHAMEQLHLEGCWWIKATPGGVLASFSREEDGYTVFCTMDLAHVMGCAVQVALLPLRLSEHFHPELDILPTPFLIIRDVPWSIPLVDVRTALHDQGMPVYSIDRYRQHIRIQLCDPLISECLLRDGFDFFSVARFAVSRLYQDNPQPANENDVTQCYRCQGFFHIAPHCRQVPRCVRCGDSHYADMCPRPRSMAVCCNCAGKHHAGYKQCPVREHMAGAIPLHFTLSVKRPLPSTAPIKQDPRSDKCRCLL